MTDPTPTTSPESIEQFYARVEAALGPERRLPVTVTNMPGWDIFPFEVDSLRIKPLEPLADAEPPRAGEDPATCRCVTAGQSDDSDLVWSNDTWRLILISDIGVPIALSLVPREHCDLGTAPPALAAEMGQLIVAITAAIEALPSVGRGQLAKYGDGGAHLHLWFFGRPLRMMQLRGSPLLDWEENLPRMPRAALVANARFVADQLVESVGGQAAPLT